jgi:lysophospholipase L1-like esterase
MANVTKSARALFGVCVVLVLSAGGASRVTAAGQAASADPAKYAAEIKQFDAWDSKNATPAHAVLFVGSSSIRFWPTAERFPSLPVINRGFGGSEISDVNYYLKETVLKYDVDLIVFYAGDNDLAAHKTPQQVADDYKTFVERVLAAKPRVQILFIAIKPSVLRWALWPEMQQANALITEFSKSRPNLHVVDTASRILGPDGKPAPGLFQPDGLHLNATGYDAWTELVGAAIKDVMTHAPR